MPSTSANINLSKYIAARRTLQNVDATAGGNVVSRYQIFNLSGFDYKGQLSCAYGIFGAEGQIVVSVNLLEVLAPLLPIANLEVAGSGSLQLEKQSMLALHRFPTGAYPVRVVMVDRHPTPVHASQLPRVEPARGAFTTATPLTLLPFQGAGGEVRLRLRAQAGSRLAFEPFIDEVGFELALEATASAELRGYYKRFSAPYVSYFAAPGDVNVDEAARLEQVVDALLYRPDKSQIKAEVEAWLEDMIQSWLSAYGTAPASQVVSRRDRARQKWREWVGKAMEASARLPIAQATENVESILNDYFLAAVNLELRVPVLHNLLDDWLKTQRTSTLLGRLRNLQKQILASSAPPPRKAEAWRQARRYEELLLRFNRRLEPTVAADPALGIRDRLSHFKAFSFAVGVEGSASASASGNVGAPELPIASGLQLRLQGEATASAEAGASAQFITYRYQAANAAGGDTLVYTQDTRLTYRRWNASAQAMAAAGFAAVEYKRQTGAMKSHCAFAYASTALFWNHRRVYQDQSGFLFTHPLNGSGLCRGMSVSTNRLIELAQGRPQPRLARAISLRFGLRDAPLRSFLESSQIGALDPTQAGLPDNLILEVGFPFADDQRIAVQQQKRDGAPVYDVVGGVSDSARLEPAEWIRIRIRVADVDRSQDPIFKLGFPAVLPRVSIDVSRIRGAGQDALFDYYVHWLNNPEYNTLPGLATWAQELSVPPVVFLHQ
ncbi:MAG: hypothetical protein SF339_00795 [Blastocatellia bacterium]|nr:hypothetical protein [Blastocatellia bacterium]